MINSVEPFVIEVAISDDWKKALKPCRDYANVEVRLYKDDPNFCIVVYEDNGSIYNGLWWSQTINSMRKESY